MAVKAMKKRMSKGRMACGAAVVGVVITAFIGMPATAQGVERTFAPSRQTSEEAEQDKLDLEQSCAGQDKTAIDSRVTSYQRARLKENDRPGRAKGSPLIPEGTVWTASVICLPKGAEQIFASSHPTSEAAEQDKLDLEQSCAGQDKTAIDFKVTLSQPGQAKVNYRLGREKRSFLIPERMAWTASVICLPKRVL